MKYSKHSYLLSRHGFWLCVLAQDSCNYYGEIIYGQKYFPGIKSLNFNSNRYFKYWQIASERKKLIGILGEKTPYSFYYQQISSFYKNNCFYHPLLGQIFRLNKNDVVFGLNPISCNNFPNQSIKKTCRRLASIWNINPNHIRLGGSVMIDPFPDQLNDLDIIINTNKPVQIINWISNAVQNTVHQVNLSNGKIHHRQFFIDNFCICPFAIHDSDDQFENANFTIQDDNEIAVDAIVTDNSNSLFSPAVYNIKINSRLCTLISYFVGHTMLFKKNDKIRFKTKSYFFKNNSESKEVYVIPVQGSWVEFIP